MNRRACQSINAMMAAIFAIYGSMRAGEFAMAYEY